MVPIEKTFRELGESLRKLRDHLLGLQLTIREDLPKRAAQRLLGYRRHRAFPSA